MPLTPARRQNTIAWIAARSDGPEYGKLLAFRFPTNSLVFGPRQIETRIDQDATIAAQFGLWIQSGRKDRAWQPADDPDRRRQPLRRADLPAVEHERPAGAQARDRRQRQQHRHGADAGARPRGDLRRGPAHTANDLGHHAHDVTAARRHDDRDTVAAATATPSPAAAAPTATQGPAATQGPLSGDAAELARQASEAYERAQAALQAGDFATYGDELKVVEQLLQQLVQVTGGQ